MRRLLKKWGKNILVAGDQFVNAVTFGDPDETISSRAAKARRDGRMWGCILCRVLDFFDKGHCDRYIEEDEGRNAVFK